MQSICHDFHVVITLVDPRTFNMAQYNIERKKFKPKIDYASKYGLKFVKMYKYTLKENKLTNTNPLLGIVIDHPGFYF